MWQADIALTLPLSVLTTLSEAVINEKGSKEKITPF